MVRLLWPRSQKELNAELGRRFISLWFIDWVLPEVLLAGASCILHLRTCEDVCDSLGGGGLQEAKQKTHLGH